MSNQSFPLSRNNFVHLLSKYINLKHLQSLKAFYAFGKFSKLLPYSFNLHSCWVVFEIINDNGIISPETYKFYQNKYTYLPRSWTSSAVLDVVNFIQNAGENVIWILILYIVYFTILYHQNIDIHVP